MDHGKEIAAETDSEPVGAQRGDSDHNLQVVTQEDTSAPLPALLRYLGSLPPSLLTDITLPRPTKDNDVLLILFARENESSAKQQCYFSSISLHDDSRGQFQPTSRDNSALRVRRDANGVFHFSIRDNKNLGNRGTLITPLTGAPTCLTSKPREWHDLTTLSFTSARKLLSRLRLLDHFNHTTPSNTLYIYLLNLTLYHRWSTTQSEAVLSRRSSLMRGLVR